MRSSYFWLPTAAAISSIYSCEMGVVSPRTTWS